MNKANKEATVQEEFKAYSVVWECNKGHKNFQTIIGKEGTQHDICLKCGEHYQYQVANGANTRTEPALPIQNVSQRSEQLAIAALDKIAHPIKYLQTEAEKEGAKLDGYMAIQITQDANFYQEIADKALKAIANCG